MTKLATRPRSDTGGPKKFFSNSIATEPKTRGGHNTNTHSGHGIFLQQSLDRSVRFGEKLRNAMAKMAAAAAAAVAVAMEVAAS